VVRKFAVAVSGIVQAAKTQNSFWVHVPLSLAIIALGGWLQLEAWRWVAIFFAIALVVCTELLNTAIEELVAVLHPEHDSRIGNALDIAAGAVLIASVAAVIIGLIVLAGPLVEVLG